MTILRAARDAGILLACAALLWLPQLWEIAGAILP
jgi:hypothetical protein